MVIPSSPSFPSLKMQASTNFLSTAIYSRLPKRELLELEDDGDEVSAQSISDRDRDVPVGLPESES